MKDRARRCRSSLLAQARRCCNGGDVNPQNQIPNAFPEVFVVLSFPNTANYCQFCNYQICVALTWLQAQKRSLKIIFCKSNDQRLLSSFCVFGQMIRSEESSNFGKVHWSRIHHLLFCLSFDQVLALLYFSSVDLWETPRFQFDPWAPQLHAWPIAGCVGTYLLTSAETTCSSG